MQGYNAHENQRTGFRPAYIVLGTDAEGASHTYRTLDETVHVVVDGQRVHVQSLTGISVDDWMAHIDDVRGWDDRQYGLGMAEAVADAVEVTDQ